MHPIATLGAGALVLEDDQVLLVSPNYGLAKGHWILPGGFLNAGEAPEVCALRELFEETGQQGLVLAPLCIRFRHEPPDVYTVFRVKRERNLPLLRQDEELLGVRFWSLEEALRSPEVRPLTKVLLAYARDGKVEKDLVPADYRDKNQFYFF